MVNVQVFFLVVMIFNSDIQHMNFFALYKKSCYGQPEYFFSCLSDIEL